MVSELLLFLFRYVDKDVDDREVFSPSGLESNLSRAGKVCVFVGSFGGAQWCLLQKGSVLPAAASLEGLFAQMVQGTADNKISIE